MSVECYAARCALEADEQLVAEILLVTAVDIVAVAGEDHIIARAAVDGIGIAAGVEQRWRGGAAVIRKSPCRREITAEQNVIARTALDGVGAGPASDGVVAVVAVDHVVPAVPRNSIVAAVPVERIVA